MLCLRRGDTMPWLWIILLTGPVGATVYLIVTFGGLLPRSLAERSRSPQAGLERARADAARLDTAGAWSELAAIAFDRGRAGEAAEAARRALAKNPGDFEARYLLGRALLASGRSREAFEPLSQVVEEKPDHAIGEALFALARACSGSGDLAAARRHLERLAERSSRADFLYDLASVELALGDRVAARTTLRRIVDDYVFVPKFMRKRVRPWLWRAQWRLWRLGSA